MKSVEKKWIFACGLLISCFCLLLLFNLKTNYGEEWPLFQWFVDYNQEYLKQHHQFPTTLNSKTYVGMVHSFFYSPFAVWLLSIPSMFIGSNFALRGAFFLIWFSQFVLASVLFRRLSKSLEFGLGCGVLLVTAIYPMTNLYNRGAIAETLATGILNCAVIFWFLFLFFLRDKRAVYYLILSVICLGVIVGTHPITSLLGAIFVCFTLVASLPYLWSNRSEFESPWKMGAVLILSSLWLVAVIAPFHFMVKKFGQDINIHFWSDRLNFHEGHIGLPWVRFFPWPLDVRTLHADITQVPTPFLDAQINMPLLFLWVGLLGAYWMQLRRKNVSIGIIKDFKQFFIILISLLSFTFFTDWSVFGLMNSHYPQWFKIVQFSYRFISYQNLSILVGLVGVCSLIAKNSSPLFETKSVKSLLIGTSILALSSSIAKLNHGTAFPNSPGNYAENSNLLKLPKIFCLDDYKTHYRYGSVPEADRKDIVRKEFKVLSGDRFGMVEALELNLMKPTWVSFNAYLFPWTSLIVDGNRVPQAEVSHDGKSVYELPTLKLNVGHHLIDVQIDLPPKYRILRGFSFWALWIGLAVAIWAALSVLDFLPNHKNTFT